MSKLPRKLLLALLVLALSGSAATAQGNSGQGGDRGPEGGGGPPPQASQPPPGDSQGGGPGEGGRPGQGSGPGQGGGPEQGRGPDNTPGNNGNGPGAPVVPQSIPNEQDVLREAVKEKRALPLDTVTELVRETTSGRILDIKLVTVNNFLLYDVTVMEKDGLVHRLYYYARSGNRVKLD